MSEAYASGHVQCHTKMLCNYFVCRADLFRGMPVERFGLLLRVEEHRTRHQNGITFMA